MVGTVSKPERAREESTAKEREHERKKSDGKSPRNRREEGETSNENENRKENVMEEKQKKRRTEENPNEKRRKNEHENDEMNENEGNHQQKNEQEKQKHTKRDAGWLPQLHQKIAELDRAKQEWSYLQREHDVSTKTKLAKIRVKIGQVTYLALVDPGSSTSILPYHIYALNSNKFTLTKANIKITGISNTPLQALGRARGRIKIEGKTIMHRWTCLDTNEIILGLDFLRRCGARWDFLDNHIILRYP